MDFSPKNALYRQAYVCIVAAKRPVLQKISLKTNFNMKVGLFGVTLFENQLICI